MLLLANKYGITTCLNFLLITSVVLNLSYFDSLNYPELDNKLSATKTKDNQFYHTNTKLLSYLIFLSSGNFVVPNLSHSDYLNLPVTVDNKLLATKKKGQSYFAYLANKYGITYLPQLPSSSSSFISINTTAF